MSSILNVRQLCLSRADQPLLHDINLDLKAGELHVLLGPNGSGKSTLLRALSGEWPIQSGHITLTGQSLQTLSAIKQARLRAVLPQHDSLTFGLTVQQLVMLGRHAAADRRPAHDQKVLAEVLQATDTIHLCSRRYPELSGGERRRAQLARVLAQLWDQPQGLLLLDEPTHSLDLTHQHSVLLLLRALAEKGFAILASLHDLNLATVYAHRFSLLKAGHLIATGTSAEVLNEAQLKMLYGTNLRFTAVADGNTQQWLTSTEQALGNLHHHVDRNAVGYDALLAKSALSD